MADLKDSYDAVVIGAGMAGLTCGALLAHEGMAVLVADRLPRPGGYCTSLPGDGFSFDPAVAILEGCDRGGIVAQTLADLKVEDELELLPLDPLSEIIGPGYKLTVRRRLAGFGEDLKSLAPAESENVDRFLNECQAVYKQMALMAAGSPDLMSTGQKLAFLKDLLLKCGAVRKYGGRSAREVTHSSFADPKLRTILHGMALFLDPGTQATILMNMLGMMAAEDVFYPRQGGVMALPDTLAKALQRDGGVLALDTEVTKIVLAGDTVTGVELAGGARVSAGCVISAVDGRETFLKLIGEEHLGAKEIRELGEAKAYGSVVVVSLGVDMDLRSAGLTASEVSYCPVNDVDELFGVDPGKVGLGIRLHSLLDPTQAPQGHGTVVLVASFPYDYEDRWRGAAEDPGREEYEELKQSLADRLVASAENVLPGLSRHIVYERVATPVTLERATLNSRGSAMGWYPSPGGKMRSQKTRFRHLYQAGHWTFPGGSVPAVVASGRNAAQLALRERRP